MSTENLDSRYDTLVAKYGEGVIITQNYYSADINGDKTVDAFDLYYLDGNIIGNILP